MQIKDPATLRNIEVPLRGLKPDRSAALGKARITDGGGP
jgi:hypothetical protein